MKSDKKTIEYYLDKLDTEGENFTKWEEDFVDSVRAQFKEKRWLSDRQEEILERIYSERTP